MKNCFFSLLSLIFGTVSGWALVNVGDPTGNTSAPTGTGMQPSDPGFANVGRVNNSTGVYLGNGWVLTANHVGAGTFTVGGNSYAFNGVDSHQIGGADLRLFKLSTSPALSGVQISVTTPLIGSDAVMIGGGRTPQSTTTTWYVDSDVDPWLWDTMDFPEADRTEEGYVTTSTRVVRWGTNVISSIVSDSYGPYSTMDFLVTSFSESPAQTAYEAQAVTNDSGGGLFVETVDGWRLAGTMATVATFEDQPGGNNGAHNALFGNLTYSVDLADYADEINSIIPEPAAAVVFLAMVALASAQRRIRRPLPGL